MCYNENSDRNSKNDSVSLTRLKEHPMSQTKESKKSPKMETVGGSVMRIQKTKRNTEMCERHVPQLLIRGEHVVSVVLLW